MKEGEWPGEVVEGVGQWTGPQRARPGPHQGMVHYSFHSSLKYIQLYAHVCINHSTSKGSYAASRGSLMRRALALQRTTAMLLLVP